jgi:hypothetical protein
MITERTNIRLINLDRVIILFVFLFGLLIYCCSVKESGVTKHTPVSICLTASVSTGITSSGIRLQVFQKESVSNKNHFDLLAFNRNPFYEDKKTDIKILNFKIIRQSSSTIPVFIRVCHLSPVETDEPPLLV